MTDHVLLPGIEDRWGDGPPGAADELDQLVYLSHLVGREPRLVQPGGGNTSIKIGTELLVKGSGTDLKTIDRSGFTRLSLTALARLREVETMSDPDMMQFMAGCMLAPGGPVPSVETPLHSLLPRAGDRAHPRCRDDEPHQRHRRRGRAAHGRSCSGARSCMYPTRVRDSLWRARCGARWIGFPRTRSAWRWRITGS